MRLTIAEFSKKYEVEKQYILENIDTLFAPYVVKEKGLTMLEDSAKEVLQHAEGQQEEPAQAEAQQEPEAQKVEPPAEEEAGELEKARQEIAQLKAELNAERESKRETEKRLLDMMDKVLELTENAQKLTAISQNRLLLEGGGTERKRGFFSRLFGKKEKPLP